MIVVDEQGNVIPEEEQINYTLVEHSGDKVIVRLLTQLELNIQKVNNLKQNLANTDYKAIKFAEGELSSEEYEQTKAQRRAWRKEINELENKNTL